MREVVEKEATFLGSLWYVLLVLPEHYWTFSIEEHGRYFSPAVIIFFFDEGLAHEVLVKMVETPKADMLQDCATQLSVTKRGKRTGPKLDSILRVDER